MAGARDFCFVHAADLHLDTPFKGLGGLAPRVAEALREASLEAFDAIVELALARRAAFLLVAGDVYDGAERGLRAQLRFRAGLERLSEARIDSFVVHGNHDPVGSGWSAVARWPERVTVFPAGEARVVPVERDGARLATVQGVSYGRRAETENLARLLRRPPGEGVHVGLLHCNVAGAADGYANYSPCTLEDLRATGLDYLALGHVHQRRVLAEGPGQPWVVYPGNSQARSVRPGELEAKGAVVVEVRGGQVASVEFAPCDRVRFGVVEVPVAALGELAELLEALRAVALQQVAAAGGRAVVLRARLVGEGPLHEVLGRPEVLDELLVAARAEVEGEDPFCWWDALLDETRPQTRLEELRVREDFAGDLVRLCDELGRDPAVARALLGELGGLPRPLAARLERLVGDEGADALGGLLERARTLALAELDTERP